MNELQAAYEMSRATYEYKRVKPAPGEFAVVACCSAHCPITDAYLPGSDEYLVRSCGTRRMAEFFAAKLNAGIEGDDEVAYEVRPKLPQPKLPRPVLNDDIPF